MFMKLFYEFHLRMWQTLCKNSLGTLHTWEMWHLLFQEKVCWCWVIFWVVSNTVFAKPIPRSLIVLQHVPCRRLLSLYEMNSDIGKLTFLSEVSSVYGNHTQKNWNHMIHLPSCDGLSSFLSPFRPHLIHWNFQFSISKNNK